MILISQQILLYPLQLLVEILLEVIIVEVLIDESTQLFHILRLILNRINLRSDGFCLEGVLGDPLLHLVWRGGLDFSFDNLCYINRLKIEHSESVELVLHSDIKETRARRMDGLHE